jgi:hypothetical protein
VNLIAARPLEENLAAAVEQPAALLALGIPRCPACMLLPASLDAIAQARPELWIGLSLFASPDDWAQREDLLWPLGIHVSRSTVPVLTLLADGAYLASRPGGAPAHVLDEWLTEHLGRPVQPLSPKLTATEDVAMQTIAARHAQHRAIARRDAGA